MTNNYLPKVKRGVIVDIDNYTNEHLSDPIFVKYIINFSEKGGACGFFSKNLRNLKILKESTSLPILAGLEENFNKIFIPKNYENFIELVDLKPNFIVIEFGDSEDDYDDLENIIKKLRENFSGQLIGKVFTKLQALDAYKFGMDALIIDIYGEYFEEEFVNEICNDVNIPTIGNLNSVSFEQGKKLVEDGIYSFILGEDVTNPNKIIREFVM